MRVASAQELADLLRREKEALLSDWEREVRTLPRENELSAPALRDHVPGILDEFIHDLEHVASSERTANVSRIHGEQRQTTGLDVTHVIDEYKLLRTCIIARVEQAGLAVGGQAGRLLNKIVDNGIKAAIAAYTARRDKEERNRREEYLTFIAHDLRAPLTAIQHAMLLLARRFAHVRADVLDLSIPEVVNRNVAYMQALIVKLLQEEQNIGVGPNLELHRSRVPLRSIAEGAIKTLSPSAKVFNTDIVNEVPGDVVISGDPELLERVFQNLISNATDYTPNGTVTIGVAVTAAGDIECRIADNGQGIPEEVKPRVFDKFQTTRRSRGGTGLGLTVAKQIIEAHGGRIRLESEVGKGTIVRFTLPTGFIDQSQPAADGVPR